ncbi:hypothetical protein MTO96_002596 [Rhipicephalus appendiculatus]
MHHAVRPAEAWEKASTEYTGGHCARTQDPGRDREHELRETRKSASPPGLVDASPLTEDLEGAAEERQETVNNGPPFAEASRGPEPQRPIGAAKTGVGVTPTSPPSLTAPSIGTPHKSEPPSGPTAALQQCKTAMPPPTSSSVRGPLRVLTPGDGALRYPSPTLPPVAKQLKRSASTPLSSQRSSAVSGTQAERTPSVSSTSSESTENLTSSDTTSSSSSGTTSSSSGTTSASSGSSSSSYITLQDGSIPWDPSRYPVRASQPPAVEFMPAPFFMPALSDQ